MNKKFFAALTSAAMLLGSPVGVLAAEEMVEVENGSVPGADVDKSEIELNEVNFPDDNFRSAVKLAYSKVMLAGDNKADYSDWEDLTYAEADKTVSNKTVASTDDLAKILTLAPEVSDPTAKLEENTDITAAQEAADYDSETTKAMPFKNIIGIEYLTLLNSPQLKEANLSENGELVGVVITPMMISPFAQSSQSAEVLSEDGEDTSLSFTTPAPFGAPLIVGDAGISATYQRLEPTPLKSEEGATGGSTTGGSQAAEVQTETGSSDIVLASNDLYNLVLPEETMNLASLSIAGAGQITSLDLSAYNGLETINLQSNGLADLNIDGCTALKNLDVSYNYLTGLDISNTGRGLTTVVANGNNIYEVELPTSKNLLYLFARQNKLATIDLSTLPNLALLDLSDNRLESIDLSANTSLTGLNLNFNHLATLDLSKNKSLTAALDLKTTPLEWENGVPTGFTGAGLMNQYLYANSTDLGIDLKNYDENFQADSGGIGWVNTTGYTPVGGSIDKAGVFTFGNTDNGINYQYSVSKDLADAEVYLEVRIDQAELMNRLYNPNSGEHFYTKDLNEKDTLVKLGWQYEGIGWIAPEENATEKYLEAGDAVFRLYNRNAGDHHYTRDGKEKDTLVRLGWEYEGVGWYSAYRRDALQGSYSISVYREYNPNAKEAGAHNYTTSENENDTLVALGWLDEGVGWAALK